MKLKLIFLTFLTILFGYLLKEALSCGNYNGNFHYSSHVVVFHLNELITTETNTPIWAVRLFHNKLTVLLFDVISRYLQFFNIFYLINILGVAGLFGLFYFYFSFFTQKVKNIFIKIFGILILLLPFLEISQPTKQAFFLKILAFILPYQIASFIGSMYFIKQRGIISYGIYFILLILSIGWIIVFQNELLSFCTTS